MEVNVGGNVEQADLVSMCYKDGITTAPVVMNRLNQPVVVGIGMMIARNLLLL